MAEKEKSEPRNALTALQEAIQEQSIEELAEIVKNVAREQITVSTAVKALDVRKYEAPNSRYDTLFADIQVLSNTVRVTSDGATTPSATVGKAWYPAETYRVWGMENLRNIRFIRESADATLIVDYWGREKIL